MELTSPPSRPYSLSFTMPPRDASMPAYQGLGWREPGQLSPAPSAPATVPHRRPVSTEVPWTKEQRLAIGAGAGAVGGLGVGLAFQALRDASSTHMPVTSVVLQLGEFLLGTTAVGTAVGAIWGAGMGGKQTIQGMGFSWTAEQSRG